MSVPADEDRRHGDPVRTVQCRDAHSSQGGCGWIESNQDGLRIIAAGCLGRMGGNGKFLKTSGVIAGINL